MAGVDWTILRAYDFVEGKGNSPMASQQSTQIRSPGPDWGMRVKTFLTAVMSLLSVLVIGIAGIERDVMWLWIGFVCCLISGVFIQLFINRIKNDAASGRR